MQQASYAGKVTCGIMEFHFVVTPEPISKWQSVIENSRLLLDQNPGAAQMSVSRIHGVSAAWNSTILYLLGSSKTLSKQCGLFREIPSHIMYQLYSWRQQL